MSLKAVWFDLDGTLLPMDQDVFLETYLGALAVKLAPHGYDKKALIGAVISGTGAMIKNDGSRTNEVAFWDRFCELLGDGARDNIGEFDDFYLNEFQLIQKVCGYTPAASHIVKRVKKMGLCALLATNPLFPAIATESRARWAGLDVSDFELCTTYENSRYCKPNLAYYKDILDRIGLAPEECLMVGNDVSDDMVASELGMRVFLLTDCLINHTNADISRYPHGDFAELEKYMESIAFAEV